MLAPFSLFDILVSERKELDISDILRVVTSAEYYL